MWILDQLSDARLWITHMGSRCNHVITKCGSRCNHVAANNYACAFDLSHKTIRGHWRTYFRNRIHQNPFDWFLNICLELFWGHTLSLLSTSFNNCFGNICAFGIERLIIVESNAWPTSIFATDLWLHVEVTLKLEMVVLFNTSFKIRICKHSDFSWSFQKRDIH